MKARHELQQRTVRAARFVAEQNRLLQKDNTALIGMVKRLRQELDELRAPKTAATTATKAAKKKAKVHV